MRMLLATGTNEKGEFFMRANSERAGYCNISNKPHARIPISEKVGAVVQNASRIGNDIDPIEAKKL